MSCGLSATGSAMRLVQSLALSCCNGTRPAKNAFSKIMRRILRKIAADDFDELRYLNPIDPSVVEDLIRNRQNKS